MSTAHLICGPVGAGKTHFSRALQQRLGALPLSLDEWMIQLYGRELPRELFEERVQRCLERFVRLAGQLAPRGVDVIFDCGFWRRATREAAAAQLAQVGVRCVLYYLDTPTALRWERVRERNHSPGPAGFEVTREMFLAFERQFEPPRPDEGALAVRGDGEAPPP